MIVMGMDETVEPEHQRHVFRPRKMIAGAARDGLDLTAIEHNLPGNLEPIFEKAQHVGLVQALRQHQLHRCLPSLRSPKL
jgi:hypothetical protein